MGGAAAVADFVAAPGLPRRRGGRGAEPRTRRTGAAGEAGFDCSGLTAAYAAAHIPLPRTADIQYHAGPAVPPGTALVAGDLVFLGDPHLRSAHVAIYLGQGRIVRAPRRGQPVQIAELADMRRYAGATRPAAPATRT